MSVALSTHSTSGNTKNAWVFLVMKGDSYVPGALVAAFSLRQVNTTYDIVCMITHDVSTTARKQLLTVFTDLIEVDYISYPCRKMRTEKQQKMYESWITESFTKWNILALIQYEKVMFVDADKIILSNIDDLFELKTPAATFSTPWADPYIANKPGRRSNTGGIHNPYYKFKHGDLIPHECVKRGFEDNSFVCIASMLLVKPEPSLMKDLKAMITYHSKADNLFGFKGCNSAHDEQAIARLYYDKNEISSSIKYQWTMISQEYNYIPWHTHWLEKGMIPRVFHFFSTKPWILKRREYSDLEVWWQTAKQFMKSKYITSDELCKSVKLLYGNDISLSNLNYCCYCYKDYNTRSNNHLVMSESGVISCPKLSM